MENDTTNVNADTTNDTGSATETAEERADRLDEQNKKLFERAKKAEADLKALKPQAQVIKSNPSPDTEDERLELRLDGYSKEEVGFIMNNGGRKSIEDKTSYVSIALNAKREQARAENAASQTADTSTMSEVERKFTPEQLKNMKASDLEKILPKTDN